jgi:ribonuclease-3
LFLEALRHRSYLYLVAHHTNGLASNERLEFLGDGVLNLVVAQYLFDHYPDADEGTLTKMRSRLVNRKALATFAKQIHLKNFMQVNPPTANASAKGLDTILADGVEALIAAIYLDAGFPAAQQFIIEQLTFALESSALKIVDENYKSQLLEFAQGNNWGMPEYAVLREEGPDHDRTFVVQVTVSANGYGIGKGKSKKDAEQLAAAQAIEHLLENGILKNGDAAV